MAARGRVNGRGPAKLGGMSEAKVFVYLQALRFIIVMV